MDSCSIVKVEAAEEAGGQVREEDMSGVSPSCSAPLLAHVCMCVTHRHAYIHKHTCTHTHVLGVGIQLSSRSFPGSYLDLQCGLDTHASYASLGYRVLQVSHSIP